MEPNRRLNARPNEMRRCKGGIKATTSSAFCTMRKRSRLKMLSVSFSLLLCLLVCRRLFRHRKCTWIVSEPGVCRRSTIFATPTPVGLSLAQLLAISFHPTPRDHPKNSIHPVQHKFTQNQPSAHEIHSHEWAITILLAISKCEREKEAGVVARYQAEMWDANMQANNPTTTTSDQQIGNQHFTLKARAPNVFDRPNPAFVCYTEV